MQVYEATKFHLVHGILLRGKQSTNTCFRVQLPIKRLDMRTTVRIDVYYATKGLATELGFLLFW
jgi:hypothetical protein